MRFGLVIAAAAALFATASAPAQAGLAGSTVTANSWFGGTSSPPGACDPTTNTACTLMDYNGPSGPTNSPLPVVPVAFLADFLTLTTTSISDTAITIVNNSPLPFCVGSLPCADVFDGFAFMFSGALPITSVTVASGSSADFRPASLAFNATAIYVNLAGDTPAVDSTLILDVTTKGTTPVPEPSTWALMLVGFAGLGFAGWRRTRRRRADADLLATLRRQEGGSANEPAFCRSDHRRRLQFRAGGLGALPGPAAADQ